MRCIMGNVRIVSFRRIYIKSSKHNGIYISPPWHAHFEQVENFYLTSLSEYSNMSCHFTSYYFFFSFFVTSSLLFCIISNNAVCHHCMVRVLPKVIWICWGFFVSKSKVHALSLTPTRGRTREFPTKFPDWDLSHSSKFGIFVGIL